MNTQSHDFINAASYGIDFSVFPGTWTIDTGVLLGSTVTFAVYSNTNNSTLFNYGQILATASEGIFFTGDNGNIVNEAGATITSLTDGVNLSAGSDLIQNKGAIYGNDTGVILG